MMSTLNQMPKPMVTSQARPKDGYLFGDSTPSPLTFDFLDFLRGAFDFAVEVLLREAQIRDAVARADQCAETTERDIQAAEKLGAAVTHTLEVAVGGDRSSIAARCAAKLWEATREFVRAESEAARAAVDKEEARAG